MSKLETLVENTEELAKMEPVVDTPFTLVQVDNQYFLGMGKYRVTPLMDKDDAIDHANILTWNVIQQVIQIMIEWNLETNKNKT